MNSLLPTPKQSGAPSTPSPFQTRAPGAQWSGPRRRCSRRRGGVGAPPGTYDRRLLASASGFSSNRRGISLQQTWHLWHLHQGGPFFVFLEGGWPKKMTQPHRGMLEVQKSLPVPPYLPGSLSNSLKSSFQIKPDLQQLPNKQKMANLRSKKQNNIEKKTFILRLSKHSKTISFLKNRIRFLDQVPASKPLLLRNNGACTHWLQTQKFFTGRVNTSGCGSKLNRRGKPQVLAHVSAYQGNPFWYRLFEPQPSPKLWFSSASKFCTKR